MAKPNPNINPFTMSDTWLSNAFDELTAGRSVAREGNFTELYALRVKFYKLRKQFVYARPDDKSPETNYLKSAYAQLTGEVKTKGKCFLTIGQMNCLVDYNKSYEQTFWKDQLGQLGVKPEESLETVLDTLSKPGE